MCDVTFPTHSHFSDIIFTCTFVISRSHQRTLKLSHNINTSGASSAIVNERAVAATSTPQNVCFPVLTKYPFYYLCTTCVQLNKRNYRFIIHRNFSVSSTPPPTALQVTFTVYIYEHHIGSSPTISQSSSSSSATIHPSIRPWDQP